MNLNYQDIQSILQILDDSPYDELRLKTQNFDLYIKRSDDGNWTQENQTLSSSASLEIEKQQNTTSTKENQVSNNDLEEPSPTEEGLIDIRSPMVGTFYRSPKPGADCFVEIGNKVSESTVIAIVEVMKLMSSIPAQTTGEIREILAEDAQFVEKGQLIMRVKPT